jgi:hypothetical protein
MRQPFRRQPLRAGQLSGHATKATPAAAAAASHFARPISCHAYFHAELPQIFATRRFRHISQAASRQPRHIIARRLPIAAGVSQL